jgi:hypothetical protein
MKSHAMTTCIMMIFDKVSHCILLCNQKIRLIRKCTIFVKTKIKIAMFIQSLMKCLCACSFKLFSFCFT